MNWSRTNVNSCGTGSDCLDLSYDIQGLGNGPYTLECWFDGQQEWRGSWSGRASTGCYYSSSFSGTIQVTIDGTQSNTISVTGTRRASTPDTPGRPSLSGGDGSVMVSWRVPSGNGAAISGQEVRWRAGGSWSSRQVSASATDYTIGGLRNGTSYEVQVRARNRLGWSAWSQAATASTGQRMPDAPGGVSARAGDGEIAVSWRASAENGSPVTGYTVSWSGGSSGRLRVGASARSHTITELINGEAYTVRVVAHSAAGDSAAASVAAFPRAVARVPDAPGGVSVQAGDRRLTVSWRASAENGSPVTGYLVAWGGGGVIGGVTLSGSARSHTITGLVNGTRYEVSVSAQSTAGHSAETTRYATPQAVARVPDAPGGVSARAGDGEIAVSWRLPSANGAAITEQQVRWRAGGSWSSRQVSASATGYTIGGLRDGTPYEVQVRARNSVGWGAWSRSATATTDRAQPQASVSIQAGSVNRSRTDSNSCGTGNDCHDLSYNIQGLGSGPYTLECRLDGQRVWRGTWSGRASTGCYYSSAFSGTIQVVIDGVTSNTITVTGRAPRTTRSVVIAHGPVNASRTNNGSCGGNNCHNLSYNIQGLGSGPYTLECWFNGQRAWRGTWSGRASTGCYYWSTFSGTIHVVIDGVTSNTIRR